jgi:hypothetical protein
MLFLLGIVGHGFMSGDMSGKMTMAAAAEMAAQDGGMDCDKHTSDQGALAACSAYCAGVVAVLSDPVPIPVAAPAQQIVAVAGSVSVIRHGPPDPYPPKHAVLI